jgi:rhodanese-related sulfurtransferase
MGAATTSGAALRGLRHEAVGVHCDFVERVVAYVPIVDLRRDADVERGRIPGAITVRMSDVMEWAMTRDPELPLVLVCEDGTTSKRLSSTLMTFGHGNVAHLAGGMRAWRGTGRPLVGVVERAV